MSKKSESQLLRILSLRAAHNSGLLRFEKGFSETHGEVSPDSRIGITVHEFILSLISRLSGCCVKLTINPFTPRSRSSSMSTIATLSSSCGDADVELTWSASFPTLCLETCSTCSNKPVSLYSIQQYSDPDTFNSRQTQRIDSRQHPHHSGLISSTDFTNSWLMRGQAEYIF